MVGSIAFRFLFPLIIFAFFTITHAETFGFSAELIHRDSLNSPLYNSSETPSQRIVNAYHRSINRARLFYPTASFLKDTPQSDITPEFGAYIMNLSIGTPPVNIVAIADTGSDLIWTQCEPCEECFRQNAPLFNPSTSSTYENISCQSDMCGLFQGNQCEGTTCNYFTQYGDRSYSNGNFALETVALPSTSGKSVMFPKTIFGCGHNNDGTFSPGSSGIIGLGGGKISFINQLGPEGSGIFSHCLTPLTSNVSSKINFGVNGIVDGEGAVSTPISTKAEPTFYFLNLEGMSVGEERFELAKKMSSNQMSTGNVIIDSGTTLTMLPTEIYDPVAKAMEKQMKQRPVQDPQQFFSNCYDGRVDEVEGPIITAHFTGADVKLNPINIFFQVAPRVFCFSLIPMQSRFSSDIGGIIGNIAQVNYLVGYDIKKGTVTFKPTDCTKNA